MEEEEEEEEEQEVEIQKEQLEAVAGFAEASWRRRGDDILETAILRHCARCDAHTRKCRFEVILNTSMGSSVSSWAFGEAI